MSEAGLRLILSTFTPEQVLTSPQLFAGRSAAVESLADSLHDSGSIPVIYGHRGVGKSSLAKQYELIARGSMELLDRLSLSELRLDEENAFETIQINAGVLKDIAELEQRIATRLDELSNPARGSRMRESRRTTRIGFSIRGVGGHRESEYMPLEATPRSLHDALSQYDGKPQSSRILVILDEFDLMAKQIDLASWLHALPSDSIRVAVCGIADDYHDLIRLHESLERKLRPIHVPPMSRDELLEILSLVESSLAQGGLRMNARRDAAARLVQLSGGLPWHMHFLGRESFRSAFRRNSMVVAEDDVATASVRLATDRWGAKYERLYTAAASSGVNVEHALRYLARHTDDRALALSTASLGGYLTSIDPEIQVREILIQLSRLGIVKRTGEGLENSDVVKFVDPSFRVFCLNRTVLNLQPRRSIAVQEDAWDPIALDAKHLPFANLEGESSRAPRGFIQEHVLGANLRVDGARMFILADILQRYAAMNGYVTSLPVVLSLPEALRGPELHRPGATRRLVSSWESSLNDSLANLGVAVHRRDILRTYDSRQILRMQQTFLRLLHEGLIQLRNQQVTRCPNGCFEAYLTSEGSPRACTNCRADVACSTDQRWVLNTTCFNPDSINHHQDIKVSSPGLGRQIQQLMAKLATHDWTLTRPGILGSRLPIVDCESCGFVPVNEALLPIEDRGAVPCPTCGGYRHVVAQVVDSRLEAALLVVWAGTNHREDMRSGKVPTIGARTLEYVGQRGEIVAAVARCDLVGRVLSSVGAIRVYESGVISRATESGALFTGNRRMSKSLGRSIDIDELLAAYGSDAVRLGFSWMTAPDRPLDLEDIGFGGMRRFLRQVWDLYARPIVIPERSAAELLSHEVEIATEKITQAIDARRVHLAQSSFHSLLRTQRRVGVSDHSRATFLRLLSPFAPVITSELWERVYPEQRSALGQWPTAAGNAAAVGTRAAQQPRRE